MSALERPRADLLADVVRGMKITVVLGGGVNALSGRVEHVGDDYLLLVKKNAPITGATVKDELTYYVPLAAIKYVRDEG